MRKNKSKLLKWNIIYIVIFLIFIIFFPNLKKSIGNQSLTNNQASVVLSSVRNVDNFITDNFLSFLDYFKSKNKLINEVNNLTLKVESLENNSSSTESFNLLNDSLKMEDQYIVASKIFTDWTSIYDTILLNKGSKDGVKVSDLVFINEDEAIGVVNTVSLNTSLITLYSKNKEKTEGVLQAIRGKDTLVSQDINLTLNDNGTETKDNLNNSSTSIATTTINKSRLLINNQRNNSNLENILIDLYGYGGGDYFAEIPGNIIVEVGAKVYLALNENKVLGEVIKVEKRDASYYQRLFIRGYYNSRINHNYYILKN